MSTATGASVPEREAGALRLGRELEARLGELEAVVSQLEDGTCTEDRPLLLISAAGLASRALAERIAALGVA